MSVELLVPETLDTHQLAAATKAALAAGISGTVKVSLANVDYTTLQVENTQLIEANAIVRYLLKATESPDELFLVDETVVQPMLFEALRFDSDSAQKVSAHLPSPEKDLSAASIALFGSVHALVCARGKGAVSADMPLTMWYQRLLNNTRVKSSLLPVFKATYNKPPPSKGSAIGSVGSAKSQGTVASAGSAKSSSEAGDKAKTTAPKDEKSVPTPAAPAPTRDGKTNYKADLYTAATTPILPKDGERNVLITSALPYVNNVPHLGNIIGSTLSADFYSRYSKARGYNTIYICGTDEYGTATETKAIEEGVTPYELCTKYHKIHKQVYDWFQIDFDHFGRTSTDKQTEIAQEMFNRCHENGFLEEREMEQLYCAKHDGFLADRYVEGTCPKCQYDDARGDQCDKCGQLLDPSELIEPRCKLDDAKPELRKTKHMYLSLQKLQPELEKWISDSDVNAKWSENAVAITNSWLKEGLEPRAITRDLKWGTPVPLEGYEKKVLYVWFDAPIGYPSITAGYTDEWRQWWKNPEQVDLVQFMGKDNTPFHAVIFPSTEIATRDTWTRVNRLACTEYLQYEGGKFSKSRNLGVFGNNAQEIGVPADVWRYYLCMMRPESSDTQFSWPDFIARNNSELLKNLGNFVNRILKFVASKYNGVVPSFDVKALATYPELKKDVDELVQQYNEAWDRIRIRSALDVCMRISARGNRFLQDSVLGNQLFTDSKAECDALVGAGINLVYLLANLLYPFMPGSTASILRQLNVPQAKIPDSFELCILEGHNLGQPELLFSRIDDKKIDEWKAKYGGTKAQETEEPKKLTKSQKKKAKADKKAQDALPEDKPEDKVEDKSEA